jgi:predicted small lipoprotein YifL
MKNYIKLFSVITMLCLFLASCGQATSNKTTAPAADTTAAIERIVSGNENEPNMDSSNGENADVNFEEIILERASDLHELVYQYMNIDKSKLCFQLGDIQKIDEDYNAYEVLSDKISKYSDFKELYSDTISGDYFDYITEGWFEDVNGKLFYIEPIGGLLGTYETWYIGYEVKEDQIIGHFAELKWGDNENDINNSDFLNDISNYNFYDIIVEKIDDKYVITNCIIVGEENQDNHEPHGIYYNSGIVDRSLITNEKLKPQL